MGSLYHVLASKLNLRAAPVTGAILTTLERGKIVEQVDSAAPTGWLHVSAQIYDQDVVGYVSATYVVAEDAAPGAAGDLSVTLPRLRLLSPSGNQVIMSGIAAMFDDMAREYGVNKNNLRLCHFLAQAAHESAGFRTLQEYGGAKYFARYDGRKDLGNTEPGDGARYHGRGIFQLTGRANYGRIGKVIGVDLVNSPELAAVPENSVRIALEYWKSRNINALADQDDIRKVTRAINGGYNGLDQRIAYFKKARSIWG